MTSKDRPEKVEWLVPVSLSFLGHQHSKSRHHVKRLFRLFSQWLQLRSLLKALPTRHESMWTFRRIPAPDFEPLWLILCGEEMSHSYWALSQLQIHEQNKCYFKLTLNWLFIVLEMFYILMVMWITPVYSILSTHVAVYRSLCFAVYKLYPNLKIYMTLSMITYKTETLLNYK
jgi:hypothetical protein